MASLSVRLFLDQLERCELILEERRWLLFRCAYARLDHSTSQVLQVFSIFVRRIFGKKYTALHYALVDLRCYLERLEKREGGEVL